MVVSRVASDVFMRWKELYKRTWCEFTVSVYFHADIGKNSVTKPKSQFTPLFLHHTVPTFHQAVYKIRVPLLIMSTREYYFDKAMACGLVPQLLLSDINALASTPVAR